MLKNPIKEALETRGIAIGTWIQMRSPEACELAGASGFDFVIIDVEHGSFGLESAVEMVRAAESQGTATILRLPGISNEEIKKALDTGATGILIPGIRNGKEALQVVQAAKYEPFGKRGACPSTRATMHGVTNWKKYVEWANNNILVWVLIENSDAVKDADSIISAGVNAVALGPFDLSMSMGLDGDINCPEVKKALTRVARIASRKGVDVIAPIFESEPEQILESAKEWVRKGCRIVVALSDRSCLAAYYAKVVFRLKELEREIGKFSTSKRS